MKIGLVGIDQANIEMIKTLKKSESIEIAGFYNVYDSFLSGLSFQNLVQFSDFEELLSNCDALFFCESLERYFDLVISAIKTGKHILLNTFFGVTKEKINKLFNLSKEASVNLQLIQTLQYNPLTNYSLMNISSPYYIDIKRMNALPDNKEMIFNHLINDVGLVLQFINGKVKRISTRIAPMKSEFYDFLSVRIEFDSGVESGLRYLFLTEKTSLKLDIFDEGTTFSLDFNKKTCKVYKRSGVRVHSEVPMFDLYNPLLKEISQFTKNCDLFDTSENNKPYRDLEIAESVLKIWDTLNL